MTTTSDKFVDFGTFQVFMDAANTLSKLFSPAQGSVVLYNNTDRVINVRTFDEKDALRVIAYDTWKIGPKQAVDVTARGKRIQVAIEGISGLFICAKSQAYGFDGKNILPKKN
ncbi:hypothetical protein LC613_43045 [Nostoc sphaeroides CHAB 2801]|uniref:hypothetical protein n=1 Tax=Nostoc sphaeroides TaxID=446679 RepID=UPI000E4B6B83|nr:hypothetical protein [Nostoc sphaeroides]MCC5634181.1 hypothetical protein [Nostoc sphaeroides CHAB 2801]